jgi:hypothetical protein
MIEFITAAFAPVNVVFTVLLLALGLYWVLVILGLLDIDLFHLEHPEVHWDVGMHVETGVEVGGHVDAGTSVEGVGPGFLHSVLHFLYVGEVPTMLLASIMVLSLWTFSMLGNHYLNRDGSVAMAAAIFIGDFAVSTLVLKFVALPLRSFYLLLNRDYNAPADVVGRVCRVVTTHVTREKMGQAEVLTKGAPLLLNVLARDAYVFQKGDEAVVVERDDAKGIYRIAPVHLER